MNNPLSQGFHIFNSQTSQQVHPNGIATASAGHHQSIAGARKGRFNEKTTLLSSDDELQ